MLMPWLELKGVPERIAAWSEITGLDLRRLGTTADADEIKDTSLTQPLVVAQSLVAFEVLRERVDLPADTVLAGHSVGELAAAAMAGVLTPSDAVALAAVRGAEMAAACEIEPTGMAAVMGGDPDEIAEWLTSMDLVPANINGAGQIVAAGSMAYIAYGTGLYGRRRPVSTGMFAALIALVLTFILDIDQPIGGLIEVGQESMERMRDTLADEMRQQP